MATEHSDLYNFDIKPDERRAEQGQRKAYEIKNLWQRHHEIVNLAARGFKQVEIAEILNISPVTVSNCLNSELGGEKLAEIRGERDTETKKTVEKIRSLTSKAIQVFHEIFDDETGQATLKDKKDVANTVLMELSGLRVPTKIQSHHTSTTLTLDELEDFKKRGIAAARESGLLIETTAEEVEDSEILPNK